MFFPNIKKCFGLRNDVSFQQKGIYLDVQSNDAYKKVQETASGASDLKFWNRKLEADKGKSDAPPSIDNAKGYVDKIFDDAQKDLDTEAKNEVENLGAAPTEPDAKKYKDANDPEYQTALEKFKADSQTYNEKVKTIEKQKKHLEDDYKGLKETTTQKMETVFAARDNMIKEVKENIDAALKGAIDPEDEREYTENAKLAADLGDDGDITSITSHEVQDYLKQNIKNIETGEVKEIPDYATEDVVQGIVAKLHVKGAEDKDPAVAFMKGLSKRESDSGKFLSFSGRGVGISDVTAEILETVGVSMKDHQARKDAENQRATKLINKIITDDGVAPQLKGMFLAKFVEAGNAGGKSDAAREKICNEVESMYKMLKASGHGGVDETGGYEKHNYIYPALGALLDFAPIVGWSIEAYASGRLDQDALETSAAVFSVLQDAESLKPYDEVVAAYNKKVEGHPELQDPKIEAMIQEYANKPSKRKTELPQLKSAIEKSSELAKLKTEIASYRDLYKYYKLNFPVSADALTDLENESDFAQFQEAAKTLRESLSGGELLKKAEEMKKDFNEKVQLVRAYQKDWDEYSSSIPAVKALPDLSQKKYSSVEDENPFEIRKKIEPYQKDLLADCQTVMANQEALVKAFQDNQEAKKSSVSKAPSRSSDAPKGSASPAEDPNKPDFEEVDGDEAGKKIQLSKNPKTEKPDGYGKGLQLDYAKKNLSWTEKIKDKFAMPEKKNGILYYLVQYDGKNYLAEIRNKNNDEKIIVYHNENAKAVAAKKSKGKTKPA